MKRLLTNPSFRLAIKKNSDRNDIRFKNNQKKTETDFPLFPKQKGQKKQQKTSFVQSMSKPNIFPSFKVDKSNTNWFQKQNKLHSKQRDSQPFNAITNFIKKDKLKQLEQYIKNNNNKFKINNDNFCVIAQNLLINQMKGIYDSNTNLRFQIITQLINFYEKTQQKMSHIQKYSQWITTILRKIVQQSQKSIPEAERSITSVEKLINKLMKDNSNLVRSQLYYSIQFFNFTQIAYYGKQQKMEEFINLIANFNFQDKHIFETCFKQSLMWYKIKNQKYAFQITEKFIQIYKRSFEQQNSRLAIVCLLIASHCGYMDAVHHFKKYSTQILTEIPHSFTRKIYQEALICNGTSKDHHQLELISKIEEDQMMKIFACIKTKNLKRAHQLFINHFLRKQATKRWSQNILYILKRYQYQILYHDQPFYSTLEKDTLPFVFSLKDDFLWSMYQRSQNFKKEYQKQLPINSNQYWNEIFAKQRAQQIYDWESTKFLDEVKQIGAVPQGTFNLETYLKQQYPLQKQKVQERYQIQKQLIKYCIKIDAVIQDQKTQNNSAINDDIKQIQSHLSQQSLKILQTAGLKDYDVYEKQWSIFHQRYIKFKRNNYVKKNPYLDPFKEIDVQKEDPTANSPIKRVDQNLLNTIWIENRQLFYDAEKYVKSYYSSSVQKFIFWGLYCKQPMAIYMGQKIAMLTGQKISHNIAQKVSDLLSYRRDIDPQIINKGKQALKIIGKIKREKIYDDNKDYHHILVKQEQQIYSKYIYDNFVKDDRILQANFLPPNLKDFQMQPAFYYKRAHKRVHQL